MDYLVSMIGNLSMDERLYGHAMLAIGTIGAKNRSDKVCGFLKDYFRKSDSKIIEAIALGFYGDGRAIPAIRGYVEKNIDNISSDDYIHFRRVVHGLGGNMSDLDDLFDYNEFDGFLQIEE